MTAKYDRDVLWPWGKFKRVPLSCIPLDYLAWFVQTGTDRIWLSLIERELLCRRDGDKVQHSRTRYSTEDQVLEVLKNNVLRQQAQTQWSKAPKPKKKSKIKEKVNTHKNKPITKHAHNTNTGSFTTPTHNFDGSPIDFSTPPF